MTTPISRIEAASEPENGPVRAKQGISSPRARRGRKCSFCASVPYFSISSPGPSEFGTMTMVTPSGLRDEILPRISDCAWAEKPRPPWAREISMPRKPCSRTKRHTSSGMFVQLVADAPIVDALAELDGRPVEKGTLLWRERDRGRAAELRPVRRAAEQFGVPADGPSLQCLALGLRDRRHGTLKRAVGGERDVFPLDLGEARHEQERGDEPAQKRPPREHRPMQLAMNEAHLRGEGEQSGGERPEPERRAVHSEREQSDERDAGENQLSHGRPPNAPWP